MSNYRLIVGGGGDGSGASDTNGGMLRIGDAGELTTSDMFSALWDGGDGGAVLTAANKAFTHADETIAVGSVPTADGGVVGWYVYLEDQGAIADWPGDGLYRITAYTETTITVAGTEAATGDGNVTVNFGGAFATLEAALAAIPEAGASEIWMSTHPTVTATAVASIAGVSADEEWLTIYGCDNTGTELADGEYVEMDAENADLGPGPIIKFEDFNNIEIRHVHVLNCGDNPPTREAGDDGILINRTAGTCYNTRIYQCKVTNCFRGININSTSVRNVFIQNTVISDCSIEPIRSVSGRTTVLDCQLTVTGIQYGIVTSGDILVVGCTIVGGARALSLSGLGAVVHNCTFYNQTSECIYSAAEGLIEYNNIMHVADPANDYAVTITDSVVYSDYGITNADTYANGYTAGDNILKAQSIIFVNAAAGDYRLASIPATFRGKPDRNGNRTLPGSYHPELQGLATRNRPLQSSRVWRP